MMTDAEIAEQVRKVVAALAPNGQAPVTPQARLVEELGFHSLALLELAVELEEMFKLPPLDATVARGIGTVRDASELVTRLVRERAER
jgi:acyl carrier protein